MIMRVFRLALVFLLITFATAAWAVLPTYDQPVRTIYLIRHGEYEHGVETPDEGELVALGRQQARLLAGRLDALPVTVTSIQASSMNRARQTAELVATHFPDLDLKLFDDIRECTPATRRRDIMDRLAPGEAAACEAELDKAWARIFRPADAGQDEHDIVVCHGNVIRWFVTRVLAVDAQAWLQMSIANCSLTVVQVRADGSCKLISFADSGHLPWSMTTYPGVTADQ